MPCMCWFDPPEESKKLVKDSCKIIINELRRLNDIGDPLGLRLDDVKDLLDHMYTGKCKEKPEEK